MGRDFHTAWAGFERRKGEDGKTYAVCRKCKKKEMNSSKQRLEGHKCLAVVEETGAEEAPSNLVTTPPPGCEQTPTSSRQELKRRRGNTGNFKDYFDSISTEDQNESDVLITKFIVSSGLPFDAVSSTYLKDFVAKLRPAYNLPDPKMIQSNLLDSLAAQILSSTRPKEMSQGVLIMSARSEDSTKCEIFGKFPFQRRIFLRLINAPSMIHLDSELSSDILKELISEARGSLNLETVSVLHTFELNVDSDLNIQSSLCHHQVALNVRKSLLDVTLKEKILSLMSSFPIVDNFDTKLDEFEVITCFNNNLLTMRETAATDDSVSEQNVKVLYDKSFLEAVKLHHNKLGLINEILIFLENENVTLGESVEKWKLFFHEVYVDNNQEFEKEIFSDVALLSNILNPKLKGASLDQNQKLKINFKVMKLLSGTSEYGEYVKFLKGTDKFSEICLNEISPEMFWETFAMSIPKLSKLALMYSSFPASTYVKEKKDHPLFEKSDKYKFVQEMLK